MINRRRFLLSSTGLLLLQTPQSLLSAAASGPVFSLGVASGCPRENRVILWTRLAPDPLHGGGMLPDETQVRVRVCRDEMMRDTLIDANITVTAEEGHSVHYPAEQLAPGRDYWYQFYHGEEASPVGRTRTAPAGNDDVPVRMAFASCQHLETGHFAAFRDMAEQRPDLIVHLGDYIYEYGPGGADRVRQHQGPETRTLWDYRNRYAQYRLDPHLQAAHAAAPWLMVPDDHEVDNNWAGYTPEDPEEQTDLEFRVRRWAALQAYYEHMPVERPPQLAGLDSELRLYDSYRFGRQLRILLMDTRQYRDDQVCSQAFPSAPHCDARLNPRLNKLGRAQEQFFQPLLSETEARWNVLAQQTWFTSFRYPGNEYNMDQWDGYAAQRQRIKTKLAAPGFSNPVVLSGDWHCGAAMNVPLDDANPESTPVAVELATTSISSNCPWSAAVARALPGNPQLQYWTDNRRGYVLCEFNRDRMQADYRLVDSPTDPGSAVFLDRRLEVIAGRRGFAG